MTVTIRTLAPLFFAAALVSACGGGGDDGGTPAPAPAPGTPLAAPTLSFTAPGASIDLANYIPTGRYSLPVGSGANLQALEASAVTYDKDTDTLFVLGDGGTSITQVTKKGVLVDTMTLGTDASQPQGTAFYDPEGIAYIGNGRFVMALERYRQVVQFSYAAGTTLSAADVKTVTLGTTLGNIGLEGVSYDPATGGYLVVKESGPSGIFQTGIDFAALTATNGSPTTENSTNLFDPAKAGLTAFSDVFALANVLPSTAADYPNFLIVSGPDGLVRELDRSGQVLGTLDVGKAPQNEGVAMDADRNLYVVNEVGGGTGRPQLLVYSPTKDAGSVARGSRLYLTFAKPIVAGSGNLVLRNESGDERSIAIGDATQVSIAGNTLVIAPATALQAGTRYRISFAAGLVKDSAGNGVVAVAQADATPFQVVGTLDTAAPLLVGSTPANGATGVAAGPIVLSFNETVVAGSGSITLGNDKGGGTDQRSIAIGDATQVAIAGDSVTITPATPLAAGTTYTLQFAAGVLKDEAGNAFAGLADATALRFALAPAAPTVLQAGDLLFLAGNADAVDAFAFVLMKPVTAGTQIGFTDRDYVAATGMPASGESAYVWSADVDYPAGTLVTIQPDMTTPLADKGSIAGAGGGISATAETIYAFQGSIAALTSGKPTTIVVDRFIAALNLAGGAAGDIPTALTAAGAYATFALDNVKYTGSLDRSDLAAFAARVRDAANWSGSDAVAWPLTNNSLFP
jgi:uncharacterized protein YjiK/methionine-rich copper-binding protein CopC